MHALGMWGFSAVLVAIAIATAITISRRSTGANVDTPMRATAPAPSIDKTSMLVARW